MTFGRMTRPLRLDPSARGSPPPPRAHPPWPPPLLRGESAGGEASSCEQRLAAGTLVGTLAIAAAGCRRGRLCTARASGGAPLAATIGRGDFSVPLAPTDSKWPWLRRSPP